MRKKTEAKCDGMMLTVGFHGANPPLIWRFDLERNHSFTLALQGEEGEWELGITSPKGDFYPVAHFNAHEDAEEAFTKVGKVLSIRKGTSTVMGKALQILAIIVIVIVLGVALFAYIAGHSSVSSSSVAPTSALPSVQQGVPLPADEVLKPPR